MEPIDNVEKLALAIVAKRRTALVENIANPRAYEAKILQNAKTDGTLDDIHAMRIADVMLSPKDLAEAADLHISTPKAANPQEITARATREHIKAVESGGCEECGATYCMCGRLA